MTEPYFKIPLDLPHAGTIARRIVDYLDRIQSPAGSEDQFELLLAVAGRLTQILDPYRLDGENPADPQEAARVVKEASRIAKGMVGSIERLKIGSDRLGQHVRNLFECLEMGREGAELGLKAGEDPKSPQRPS
ncbi:hypothetical protein GC173_01555 [bacterium]|nr:hypothetical protein [bacterium]